MVEKYQDKGGRIIEVIYDEYSESPREFGLTEMVCFHDRYELGDDLGYRIGDYNTWDELEKGIMEEEDVSVIRPLYLYDHSGVKLSILPFSSAWDSGQVGFVYMTKGKVREVHSTERVSTKQREWALEQLRSEVIMYSEYLEGSVYGYRIIEADGTVSDTLYGFYGIDSIRDEIRRTFPNMKRRTLK